MNKIYYTNKDHIFEEYVDSNIVDTPDVSISFNINKKYQKHLGFGGALTDSACISFNYLSKDNKEKYLKAYFSKEGLNYNLIRYPLGSCDFSTHNYHYLSNSDINSLSIECDKKRIEMYKEISKYRDDLIVFSSPWSPPSFMKDNNDMNHGGKLKKEYYDLYAEMLIKSISLLREEGLNIKVINIQNEPLAEQVWDSCIYTGIEEGDFVSNYLLRYKHKYHLDDVSIGIWDHNRDVIVKRVKETFKSSLKVEDVSYAMFHWYSNKDFEQLDEIHRLYPSLHLVMSEGCVELLLDKDHPVGDFSHAERYIHQIINDLNHFTEGYIDWNLSLDDRGGPNHVGNYCEAPIMISEKGEMILNYSYYGIKHFSYFIEPGSYRIDSSCDNPDIELVSYENPYRALIFVIYNKSDNVHVINNPVNKNQRIKILPHTVYSITGEL